MIRELSKLLYLNKNFTYDNPNKSFQSQLFAYTLFLNIIVCAIQTKSSKMFLIDVIKHAQTFREIVACAKRISSQSWKAIIYKIY